MTIFLVWKVVICLKKTEGVIVENMMDHKILLNIMMNIMMTIIMMTRLELEILIIICVNMVVITPCRNTFIPIILY